MTTSEAVPFQLPTNLQTVAEFEQWQRQYVHEGSQEFVRGLVIDRGSINQKYALMHSFLGRQFAKTESFRRDSTLATRLDCYISNTCLRVPDLSFYDDSQTQGMRRGEKQSTRFAIEILSDSESYRDVTDKIAERGPQDYFDAGAQLVWYVVPEQQKIYVYTSPDELRVLKGTEVISAAPVLPDFQFTVAELFAK